MKRKAAWAVVRKNGYLLIWDGRCPVFWQKQVAEWFIAKHGLTKICRVTRAHIDMEVG